MEDGSRQPTVPLCFSRFLPLIPSPLREAYLVEGMEVPLTHMLLENPRLRQEG